MITREIDYAIRIMRALATGEKINMQRICETEFIPKAFAYKIIQKLSKSNFVEIERGINGGCRLATDLDKVTLFDLITAIQEDLFINACLEEGYCCVHCSDGKECSVRCELQRIQAVLVGELQRNPLSQVLKRQNAKIS